MNIIIIAFGLAMAIAGMTLCSSAYADGDRIDPSVPISEQVSQEAGECRNRCLESFEDLMGFPWESVTNMPPVDLYRRFDNRRWSCMRRCGE